MDVSRGGFSGHCLLRICRLCTSVPDRWAGRVIFGAPTGPIPSGVATRAIAAMRGTDVAYVVMNPVPHEGRAGRTHEKEIVLAIDFHCNLFTPESIRRNWYETPEMFRLIQWWKMEDRVQGKTVGEFVAMMDQAGCDKVLVPAIRMFSFKRKTMVWDITEEEVLEVVRQAEGRVVGLAGFNPFEGMESVRRVERAVKEYGFKGVYIHPYGWGIPLNHRQFYPLYAKCCELGVPVSMQVGHSAEHMPNEMGRPIHMDDVALDFPELNLVGAHTGWPWTEEMISLAWKHENVYVGIDAHNPKYLEPSLVQFMKTRGQNKVLWGTNYPAVMHGEAIRAIRVELGLSEKVAEKVLHGNAARIYHL